MGSNKVMHILWMIYRHVRWLKIHDLDSQVVYDHEHVENLLLHKRAVTKVTVCAGCGSSSMITSSRLRLIFRHFVNGRIGDMSSKFQLPTPETALSGRPDSMKVAGKSTAASSRMLTLA